MKDTNKAVGSPISRIDGIAKVTGKAPYSMDHPVTNPAYAILFKSTIAAGTIREIDSAAAEKAPGVLAIITHKNAPKLNVKGGLRGGALLQSPEVEFFGQNIGIVVAETFEQARYASRLINVTYDKKEPKVDFDKVADQARMPKDKEKADAKRGDVQAALGQATYKVEEVYETPIEHHHPMEPHAAIAEWNGDKVTLYSSAQIVNGAQSAAAATLNLQPNQVRIVSPYIGGGFGSKGGQWANLALAAVAAKQVNRPVKLALTRQQMVNSVGLRQHNRQKVSLAATGDGKLTALAHEITTHCAINDEFVEPCGDCSKIMYDTPNSLITYRVAPMNLILPTYTRGPGKSTGSFALESAMDELAYKLKMDPIAFRIKNEPERDPSNGKPWSSRTTVQCLREGAKAFGWEKRKPEPRQNSQGNYWIGYGVSAGTYPAHQRPTSASVKLTRAGETVTAIVELAAADLGTGTYTILTQTAADALGLAVQHVKVKIGDSDLPPAAGAVGSVGAASYANAVNDACEKITQELLTKSGKQFFVRPTAAQLMRSEKLTDYQTRVDSKPPENTEEFSAHSFNANFAEVAVNKSTGMVRVNRFLAVTGAGKILNPKTARSQIIGGNVWGIGMALTEESVVDPRWGNFVTRSLGDYHVPANLDIGHLDAIFINETDEHVNTLGVKGIGEVGIVAVAAAVANAVFNATGKRVRELPITPDKVL
ncbi:MULTISPECIES: xanthine dehydrogenase family protein molybdopterin-binding subunit [unclassified Spirosoma]|uniref:xanthine dehydrogenase family protein molybdopterin-binding subunit n=1 Tax=unclassified Spirosoma TaxID=2621999 RepID=UPI000967E515|nr:MULTISPECIES: xanthine dehydrogenase family protein molybdopterin-binding subunit [unclassified Spirosoma]MBN8826834.1 xanthine dehydrogenase family protein molybdopterin-binding subunit [Spirosoma sp.]OJW80348.1 MAG: acylaldehyde oxidase [Spirosoma sp. 48-14]